MEPFSQHEEAVRLADEMDAVLLVSTMDAALIKRMFSPKHVPMPMRVDKIDYAKIPSGGAVVFGMPEGNPHAEEAAREVRAEGKPVIILSYGPKAHDVHRKTFN